MSNLNTASLVPIDYTQDAQSRIDELRAMRQSIPHFVMPVSKNATQQLNTVASLPPEFVELTAVAVRNSASLVRNGATEPATVRDLMTYGDAYLPLADELEALAHFIRHSVAAARHKAGIEALTIYAFAKRLAKRPEHADLVPHVADMRRALGPRFKRKAATPVTPKPAEPSPTTPSPK